MAEALQPVWQVWLIFRGEKILLKKYGAVVISPEYRRSIKHPFPAAFDDCCETLEYMYKNAEKLGIDKNKIIVGGKVQEED